jgi:hypothetical protein
LPVFYGFIIKSAQQTNQPIPKLTWREHVQGTGKVGSLIGLQIVLQNAVEKEWSKKFGDPKERGIAPMVTSSLCAGALSAVPLGVVNGITLKQSAWQAFKGLTAQQIAAISVRETTFLGAVQISGPVSDYMERTYGKNDSVKHVANFSTGVIGSLMGHPFDTVVSCLQKKVPIQNWTHLARGAPIRAVSVGGFVMFYKACKES